MKTRPFSLRLTENERAQLEREAADTPLGEYVRARLFAGRERPQRTRRSPVEDRRAMAQALGRLGQMKVSADLGALAEAARMGALPVTPETEAALGRATRDVAEIKSLLMRALGVRED